MEKIWTWVKRITIGLGIIIVVVLSILFLKKSNLLEKLLNIMKDSYGNQVTTINDANEKEKERLAANQALYEKTVKELEEKYAAQDKVLSEREKERAKQIVKDANGDANKLNEQLKKEFGF